MESPGGIRLPQGMTTPFFVQSRSSMSNLRYFDNIAYGNLKDLDVLVDPDGNKILITYPTIEKVLGYEPRSTSEKLGAKKLKAFTGKDLARPKTVDAIDTKGRPHKMKAVPFWYFFSSCPLWSVWGEKPRQNKSTIAINIGLRWFVLQFNSGAMRNHANQGAAARDGQFLSDPLPCLSGLD